MKTVKEQFGLKGVWVCALLIYRNNLRSPAPSVRTCSTSRSQLLHKASKYQSLDLYHYCPTLNRTFSIRYTICVNPNIALTVSSRDCLWFKHFRSFVRMASFHFHEEWGVIVCSVRSAWEKSGLYLNVHPCPQNHDGLCLWTWSHYSPCILLATKRLLCSNNRLCDAGLEKKTAILS